MDTPGDPQEVTVEDGGVVVTPRPVGGVISPVSRLELLASWLGLVAITSLGAVAIAFLVQRDQG